MRERKKGSIEIRWKESVKCHLLSGKEEERSWKEIDGVGTGKES